VKSVIIQALRGKSSVGNYNFEMPQKPYFREQIRSPYFASQIRGKYGKSVTVNTSGYNTKEDHDVNHTPPKKRTNPAEV
jgi:hypothetical protein